MKMILSLAAMFLCTLIPLSATGGEVKDRLEQDKPNGWLRTIDWQQEFANRELPIGVTVKEDLRHGSVLTIDGALTDSETLLLVTIESPGITKKSYKLSGQIRYENVRNSGYLEMWSHFGESKKYYTKTLGKLGPMALLDGSSEWRDVTLPFSIAGAKANRPDRLVLNLVLPGEGEVQLTNLELVEGDSFHALAIGGYWPWKAGTIVGILGALFGCCGGVYGWSRSTGRWWSVMQYFPKVCYICGAASLMFAVFAYAIGWNWEITYATALLGLILILATAGIEWQNRSQHRDASPLAEERRMRSLDA